MPDVIANCLVAAKAIKSLAQYADEVDSMIMLRTSDAGDCLRWALNFVVAQRRTLSECHSLISCRHDEECSVIQGWSVRDQYGR